MVAQHWGGAQLEKGSVWENKSKWEPNWQITGEGFLMTLAFLFN